MDALGLFVLANLFILGIIAVIAFVICMITAAVKNDADKAKMAWRILGAYGVFLGLAVSINLIMGARFDRIPDLSVKNNQVTILNWGTGSMGSSSEYEVSTEGVIALVDEPYYAYHMAKKFGYTFEPIAVGKTEVYVTEYDFGEMAYVDIYEINVSEDLIISAEKISHMDF